MLAPKKGAHVSRALQQAILKVGGTIPGSKKPLYRLLLAEDRLVTASGAWTIWADNLTPDERGGLGIQIIQERLRQFREVMLVAVKQLPRHQCEAMARELSTDLDDLVKQKLDSMPLRTDLGVAQINLYPFEGWILEKWKPAHSFGSPAVWEQYRFNGENALGPYPYDGDYELVAGPTPNPLTIKQVEDAIREDFKTIQSRPVSARERVAMLMSAQEQQRKKREADRHSRIAGMVSELPDRRSLKASQIFREVLTENKLESVLTTAGRP